MKIRYARKHIKQRNKRRRKKSAKNIIKTIRLLGVNTAGLNSNKTTFRKIISDLNPALFFIEETKFKDTRKMKSTNDYIIFEKVRAHGSGGWGVAIKDLHLALVREDKDDIEAISIEIFLTKMKIRCVVA